LEIVKRNEPHRFVVLPKLKIPAKPPAYSGMMAPRIPG
jgi:hypothetical protein